MSVPESLFPEKGSLEAKLASDALAGAYNNREVDIIARLTHHPEIIEAARRVQDREAHALDQLSPWTADPEYGARNDDA